MDFMSLVRRRASVRSYADKAVEKEKIDLILEAGRIAPTAANKQPQRFLVVEGPEGMAKLATACDPHGAPMAIVTLGDERSAWIRPFDGKNIMDTDVSIACDHMMLAAASLGLGSCWIDYFDAEAARKAFNIPKDLAPMHVLALGYAKGPLPSPERHATERKPMSEMVTWGGWR